MAKVKKVEVKIKVKSKAEPEVKAKAVKPLKAVKASASEKLEGLLRRAAPRNDKVEPEKTPKLKKAKPTASIGTINLKGKEAELLKKYQHGKNDTGSTEVQVALFTAKISSLSKHLKKHGKDSDSKRGLLIMVGKRRRLLNYLAKSNPEQYEKLIKDLGLRK